jgi:hypothetical protein
MDGQDSSLQLRWDAGKSHRWYPRVSIIDEVGHGKQYAHCEVGQGLRLSTSQHGGNTTMAANIRRIHRTFNQPTTFRQKASKRLSSSKYLDRRILVMSINEVSVRLVGPLLPLPNRLFSSRSVCMEVSRTPAFRIVLSTWHAARVVLTTVSALRAASHVWSHTVEGSGD